MQGARRDLDKNGKINYHLFRSQNIALMFLFVARILDHIGGYDFGKRIERAARSISKIIMSNYAVFFSQCLSAFKPLLISTLFKPTHDNDHFFVGLEISF